MNAPNPTCRISSLRLVCSALAAVLLAMPEVHAATYYWDTNDTTAGFGTAGGTWAAPTTNNSTQGWSPSSAGTATLSGTTTTSTLDALNFGTASAGLAAGTITVSGNVSANSLTFGSASGNITLSGGNITIGGTTPTITVNNAQVTITKLLGINTASGLTKNGTGKLVVQGGPVVNNATYPVTINGGTLRFETTTADVGWAGNYTINNGATFETLGGASGTNRQLWNGSKFNFDSNGGGTVTFDNQNPILNNSVFTTTGGAMNTVGGNANLNGQGGKTLTFNVATGTDAVDLQVSASLGNMGFTKTGNGVMALTNTANSLNAGITISAGTLEVALSGRLNSGSYSVNIINNGTFSYNSTAAQTLSGVISGTGALTKSNTSTLTLSGSNTYSGATTINGGTIQLGGGGTTGTLSTSSAISTGSGGVFSVNRTNTVTQGTDFSGSAITGTGGFLQNGSGTTILNATNTYNGSTTISAGTLQIDGNIANSGLVINSGGIISPGTTAAADSFGASSITINGGGYNWTLNTANGSAGSGWDQITSTGALTSTGQLTVYAYGTPGDWNGASSYDWDIISANSMTGFSGANFALDLSNFGIDAGNRTGTWSFSNPSGGTIRLTYTAASGEPVWIGGTGNFSTGFSPAASNGDTIAFSGAGGTATNDTLTSVNDLVFRSGAGAYTIAGTALTVNGAISNNSTATQIFSVAPTGDVTANANAGDITITGIYSGSGNLTKGGVNTLTLSNNNTYSGATTINAGTLEISAAGLLGGGSYAQNITNNGTLIYSGTNAQTLSGIISGTGALTKNAASTLTLTGNNSYSGATTINTGTLQITGAGQLGGGSYFGDIAMAGGAFTYNSTADQTFSGRLSGSGELRKGGSGILTLSGNSIMTNGVYMGMVAGSTITGGTVRLAHNNAIGTAAIVWYNDGTIELAQNGLTIAAGTTYIYNQLSATDGKRRYRLDLAGSNTGAFSGGFDVRISGLVFDVGTDDSLTLSGNITSGGAGTGGFEKTGAGTLVLTGSNDYKGTTVISAGTLQVGAGGTTGSLTTNNNAVTNNGTLVFNRSNAITVANAISGTGVLIQDGSGTLTLTGSNTYTGQTNIQGGKVVFTNSSAFGTSSKIVMGLIADQTQELEFGANALTLDRNIMIQNATGIKTIRLDLAGTNTGAISGQLDIRSQYSGNFVVDVGASDTLTFSGDVVTGAGGGAGLTKVNSGTLVLTGSNSYSGGTTLNSGTLVIGNAAAAGAGTITQTDGTSLLTFDTTGTIANAMSIYNVASNKTVTLTGSITAQNTTYDVASGTTLSINGSIGGSGGVTKEGDGTLELNAANTFTGATVVNFGTLEANATGALASTGNITVTGGSLLVGANNAINDSAAMELAGGTLEFNGNINETVGALTLSANSVIDMGGGNVALEFSNLVTQLTSTTRLNIYNYTLYSDHLYFGSSTNLSDSLPYISFYSGFGTGFIGNSFIEGISPYEIRPVPEPETWATAAILLIGGGVWICRRKRQTPAGA